MKLRHVLFSILAGALLVGVGAASAADSPLTADVIIADQRVSLPVPAEFEAPSVTPPPFMRLFEEMQPSANRLLAVMLSKKDVARFKVGDKNTQLSRYLVVRTMRKYEKDGLTQGDLEQGKAIARHPNAQMMAAQQALITQSANRVARDLGKAAGDESFRMQSGDIHALGMFDDQPNSFSVANLQTTGYDGKAGNGQYVQVVATAFILVHGKPLVVVVYDDFTTPANIDWAKGEIRDFVKRVDALNP